MSDKKKLKKLFGDWGVGFSEVGKDIWIVAGRHKKVKGYQDFAATFDFDENGKFIRIHVWE